MRLSKKLHRNNLLELLNNYHPIYGSEIEAKKNIISFINNHEDCFSRKCKIGHITASAFLLNKESDKALLMHHKKLDKWLQLGGHCDEDNDVLRVAVREVQEESGINDIKIVSNNIFDIDVHHIPERRNELEHYHYDIRFLLQTGNNNYTINSESNQLQWVSSLEEINSKEESLVRMFKKWKNLKIESCLIS